MSHRERFYPHSCLLYISSFDAWGELAATSDFVHACILLPSLDHESNESKRSESRPI